MNWIPYLLVGWLVGYILCVVGAPGIVFCVCMTLVHLMLAPKSKLSDSAVAAPLPDRQSNKN